MALKKCKECGNQVSSKAKACPKCGAPVVKNDTGAFIFILFVVIVAAIVGLSDIDTTPTRPTRPSSKRPNTTKNGVREIRLCSPSKLIKNPMTDSEGNFIKYKMTLDPNSVRTGPGMNYAGDNTGPLMESEKLYVLAERNNWINFRVTPKDEGWSAWVRKDLTISVKEVQAAREARFGKIPIRGWDGSITCVEMLVEKQVKDPDSLKFEDWSDIYYHDTDGWLVKCSFRAKNSYGGYERGANWFVIRYGQIVDVKDADAYRF